MSIISLVITENTSELERLLHRNAFTAKGITKEDHDKAIDLIWHPEYSKEKCVFCEEKAIYDTSLCQNHALYALASRK